MRIIRRLATVAATLTMATAAITGSTGSAQAADPVSPGTPGPHTYTFTLPTASSTTSTGTLAWDNTTHALTVTVQTGRLAAGTCVTAYFDWLATSHHDARAVRDCVGNDTYSYSFTDSNPSNLVGGPNRMGLCYGRDNTVGTCTYYSVVTPPTVPMNWSPWPRATAQPCELSFAKRDATGAVSTFIDDHAQRRTLVNGGC